jgi:hypothetical protein
VRGNKIILLSSLFTSLVTYQLWKITWEELFSQGMALSIVLNLVVIYRLVGNDYWMLKIIQTFLSFACIDLLDECIGFPTMCGVNEYVAAAACACIIFKKEIYLDRIIQFVGKHLQYFYKRFCVPLISIVRRVALIKIKPVANVFKRRDGRS